MCRPRQRSPWFWHVDTDLAAALYRESDCDGVTGRLLLLGTLAHAFTYADAMTQTVGLHVEQNAH